ncbi:hypothetical protein BDW68DRAFT_171735 [Aspergillus falconensis]
MSIRSLAIVGFAGQSEAHAATTLSLITFEKVPVHFLRRGALILHQILPVLKGCKGERGPDRAVSICPDRRGYDTLSRACDWTGTE